MIDTKEYYSARHIWIDMTLCGSLKKKNFAREKWRRFLFLKMRKFKQTQSGKCDLHSKLAESSKSTRFNYVSLFLKSVNEFNELELPRAYRRAG